MSQHAEIRFKEREDLNIILGMREVGESSSQHNSLWMARWTNSAQNTRGSISHSENTKTRVAEQLVIGMNRRGTTSSNLLRTSTNENFDFYFNSVTQKAMVSSNMEACGVLKGSDHFPMYNIKRKIESILNPKGKAQFTDRISELNLTFCSSEEFNFETPVQNAKNYQLTALGSCSCTEEGNVSTSSQIKCPSHFTSTQSMNSADNLSGSSKRKAVSLFEMVSMPTESYGMAQSRRKPKSCEEDFEGHDMISNSRKVEGQFEQSDALLLFGSAKALGSVGGLASSRAQKVMAHRNSTSSNSTAIAYPEKSSIRDGHIWSLHANQDPDPSQTLTTNATKSLSKTIAKPNANSNLMEKKQKANSNLMEKQQKPSEQEAHSNRWLKRLRHDNSSNDVMLKPKRLKVENNNSSHVSEQEVKSWIQRWCIKKVLSEGGENFGDGPKEELEGRQFPSIAAMAMMGKAMNKFRPGEFQRRGPSVVWNNDDV